MEGEVGALMGSQALGRTCAKARGQSGLGRRSKLQHVIISVAIGGCWRAATIGWCIVTSSAINHDDVLVKAVVMLVRVMLSRK